MGVVLGVNGSSGGSFWCLGCRMVVVQLFMHQSGKSFGWENCTKQQLATKDARFVYFKKQVDGGRSQVFWSENLNGSR